MSGKSAHETRDLGRATAAGTVRWVVTERGRILSEGPSEEQEIDDQLCNPATQVTDSSHSDGAEASL